MAIRMFRGTSLHTLNNIFWMILIIIVYITNTKKRVLNETFRDSKIKQEPKSQSIPVTKTIIL